MELLCSLLVGVCLNTQGLVNRKDLEEEGKVPRRSGEFVGNLTSNKVWVRGQDLRKTRAGADHP